MTSGLSKCHRALVARQPRERCEHRGKRFGSATHREMAAIDAQFGVAFAGVAACGAGGMTPSRGDQIAIVGTGGLAARSLRVGVNRRGGPPEFINAPRAIGVRAA